MINKIFSILFLVLLAAAPACTGSPGTGDVTSASSGTVGTIANKPAPISWKIFPDTNQLIPETALVATDTSNMSDTSEPADSTDEFLKIAHLWNQVLLKGTLRESHITRDKTESFFRIVEQKMNEAGITEITEAPQTLDLSDTELFLGASNRIAALEMQLEPTDPAYFRFYFVNDLNQYMATYLVKLNEAGEPVTGLFAFVNPDLLRPFAKGGWPLVLLSYDFTYPENYQVLTSDILFAPRFNEYKVFQLHHQYNSTTQTGSLLHAQIVSASPTRNIKAYVRADWNVPTAQICLAPVNNVSGMITATTTYEFTGPIITSADEISKDTCTLSSTIWQIVTPQKIPYRVKDTTPLGGTPLKLYRDGETKEGWNSLTPTMIGRILKAESVE